MKLIYCNYYRLENGIFTLQNYVVTKKRINFFNDDEIRRGNGRVQGVTKQL